MANILIVESSANLSGSTSRQLTQEFVAKLSEKNDQHTFIYRDLVKQPIDILNDTTVAIIRTKPEELSNEQRQATQLSETLINELKAADAIVIGSAMYNWNISASLKAWLDQVMRIGFTFGYGENGLIGLLNNKPTLAILSRGGSYDSPERAAVDMQKPYLANVLAIMGLDVSFATMEGALMPEEARSKNLAKARAAIDDFIEKISQ